KRRHEAPECGFERTRIEQSEYAAERIVARYPMLQTQNQPQQPFFGKAKSPHVRARRCPAHQSRQRNKQNFQKIVSRVLGPRVRQGSKSLPEVAHPTPSAIRESPSESSFRTNAIGTSSPNAIPLPCGGGVGRGVATDSALATTPHPVPPPQGGRGRCGTSPCTISGVPAELGQRNPAWASLTAASPNAARRCRRPCAGTRRGGSPQPASSRREPPAAGSAGSIPRGNGRLRRRRRPCARAPGSR